MATMQQVVDVTALSLDGSSILGAFANATLTMPNDLVNAKPASRNGMRNSVAKKSWSLSTELMSVVSGSRKVQHTDISVFTLDGVDYLGIFNGTLTGTITQVEGSLSGSKWKDPQNTDIDFGFSGKVLVPTATGGAQALLSDAASSTLTDAEMVVSFTLNGIAVTLPMTLASVSLGLQSGGLQEISIELSGNSPDSGAYPTAPTGTSSLLEKAFNSYKTAITFAMTTHATEGGAFSGSAKLKSYSIGMNDGQLVNVQYNYEGSGALTFTPN
ncbi:MAG: hypothetical protein ACOYOL_07155 [Chthoniobacterales bacterium]